ncbi:MAG: citrate transporter [Lachnospiraceae bacterium]|nr:citrate transporter [Lachnospiraceae bacterium]
MVIITRLPVPAGWIMGLELMTDRMNSEKKKFKLKITGLDPVFMVAWILAIISSFFVTPGKGYLEYIDFRSLGLLWGLMVVIQGYRENSVFEKFGAALLKYVKSSKSLMAVLVFLTFFMSMFITNDVALITFVPFALLILRSIDRRDMMVWVVVLQTVAANLGSMLTPIGNPQNLYMTGITGMGFWEFVLLMLPLTGLSALGLLTAIMVLPVKKGEVSLSKEGVVTRHFGSTRQIVIYSLLFAVAFGCVLRIIPWQVFVVLVLIVVGGMDVKILLRADYVLLLTFVGFFIFTGNMGNIPKVKEALQSVLDRREFIISVILSQFISNVPATLMLSGFTERYRELIMGVNVGGLGTLIASMASLISYKQYTADHKSERGRYLLIFTLVNIAFLILLAGAKYILRL